MFTIYVNKKNPASMESGAAGLKGVAFPNKPQSPRFSLVDHENRHTSINTIIAELPS